MKIVEQCQLIGLIPKIFRTGHIRWKELGESIMVFTRTEAEKNQKEHMNFGQGDF